jgi:protein-tyrosine-phosphatase
MKNVIFACVDNAGRPQMAAAFFSQLLERLLIFVFDFRLVVGITMIAMNPKAMRRRATRQLAGGRSHQNFHRAFMVP